MAGPTDADATIDRLLQEAVAAYKSGRFAAAELCCHRILKRHPDQVASLQILAAVAGQTGAVRRAIELSEKVIALQPDRADGHIQLAKLLRLEERTAEALVALDAAIALEPANAAAHNDLGLIFLAEAKFDEAVKCFARAVELRPDFAIAHFNLGLAFERHGKFAESAAAFWRAIECNPDFTEAYAKLGNLQLSMGHRAEGLASFRKAAANSGSAVGSMCQARLLIEEGDTAAAESPARKAVGVDPYNSDAHCLLGSILMELGKFPDAACAFDFGIALNRRQTSAYYELVRSRKLGEADRPLIDQMEWMVKAHDLGDEERGDIHLALGKAYDDLDCFHSAIGHYDVGNRLKHRTKGTYLASKHTGIVDRIIATFDANSLSRHATIGCDSEVPVLIVGMPRSGTTLIEQILSSHPAIAGGGELSFLSERIAGLVVSQQGIVDPAWAEATVRDYQAVLRAVAPSAERVTDKMPQNFLYLAVIRALFPRARIIHCLRHPVDTCLSIYFQNFASKLGFAYHRDDLVSYYRQYLRLMSHWRSILPADRFLEIQYEELVADREPVARRMIEFCGLVWDEACLHSERNPRPIRTASVWQARQPVYRSSVERWRHYEPWLGSLRELLPESE